MCCLQDDGIKWDCVLPITEAVQRLGCQLDCRDFSILGETRVRSSTPGNRGGVGGGEWLAG